MKRQQTGQYLTISTVGREHCKAFLPDPLPPKPALLVDATIQDQLDKALLAIGGLRQLSLLLPDASLFLYMYIRKEAVLSSQIEGTQSSLSDLLRHESKAAPGVPIDDVQEVSNYVAAMNHGLARIKEGFPLSNRLLKEIHGVLLSKGKGADKDPGQFRRSQNWLGGTRPGNAAYIPPPPEHVGQAMGDLEKFVYGDPVKLPLLITAALAHVQFETIHPFLDGNGRIGRLLVTLFLCAENALTDPTLYLSLYFKSHRAEYYDLLQRTRTEGDWEAWVSFFLTGVEQTANQAIDTARRLRDLFERDQQKAQELGKATGSALRVLQRLQVKPISAIKEIAEPTGLTIPTVTSAIGHLQKLGIVVELPKEGRARLYSYQEYLGILNEGTEPL
jgi:Fic family protein